MIVRRAAGELILVDQVEHGRVAGELTAEWGSDAFVRPAPEAPVHLASARHDEGWREEDERPLLAGVQGRPANFVEVAQDRHVELYRHGVRRVLEQDLYAGLLVSMHWTGLYRGRWGAQGGGGPSDEGQPEAIRALLADTVDAEERRWIELKRALWGAERPRADLEAELWLNYELLQAWDVLSLALCTMDLEHAGDGEPPTPVGTTLSDLARRPGARVVRQVPTAVGAPRVDMTLRVLEPGVVAVDPWPLHAAELALEVATRRLPDRRYAGVDEVRAALEPGTPLRCVLRRGRGRG